MNFNLYLPDDLGQQARDEKLKLSRLLRDAVVRELHRRSKISELLSEAQVHEVELGDEPQATYTGLINGTVIVAAPDRYVFLTSDKRVIIYYGGDDNPGDRRYFILEADSSERELIEFLGNHLYDEFQFAEACRALGVRPAVEL